MNRAGKGWRASRERMLGEDRSVLDKRGCGRHSLHFEAGHGAGTRLPECLGRRVPEIHGQRLDSDRRAIGRSGLPRGNIQLQDLAARHHHPDNEIPAIKVEPFNFDGKQHQVF